MSRVTAAPKGVGDLKPAIETIISILVIEALKVWERPEEAVTPPKKGMDWENLSTSRTDQVEPSREREYGLIEIRFHGMGGQGAVMGALALAEAALAEGKYAQKIPIYGAMRRGGDVTVFLRLDEKPIRRTCGVYEPDAIVVLDPTLTNLPEVRKGLKKGGIAILNDVREPGEVELGVELSRVATLDATAISAELFGKRPIPITNTAMLGAISRATGWVRLESLEEPIKRMFPGRTGELNIEACRRGYERVRVQSHEPGD